MMYFRSVERKWHTLPTHVFLMTQWKVVLGPDPVILMKTEGQKSDFPLSDGNLPDRGGTDEYPQMSARTYVV